MTPSSIIRQIVLIAAMTCVSTDRVSAQANHFSADLLSSIRRAATLIPGDAPTSVRVVLLDPGEAPLSEVVEGASGTVTLAFSVFQIRFPRGWIMVDAALDRSLDPESTSFSDEVYTQIQEALRDARLVVVTHEHHDHVAGVMRSPFLSQIQTHTMLTRPQVQSLMNRPNDPKIRMDAALAAKYLVVDYDPFIPIAPGVVLIKAPGHTPGSQLVYVRLQSGAEILLAGDVAWNMAGIETQRHKPEASTKSFGGEDREALTRELRWLREIRGAQTTVVISHDVAWLNALISRGVLKSGFDTADR